MNRIGIDLGGTKIELRLFDDAGQELARDRTATPRDYDGTIRHLVTCVSALEARHGPARVGLAHPGSLSPASGLMRNANSTWLNGRPFGTDLARALDREVRLANDANCFALSEAMDGAGREGRVVFGVILGTGTGGGLVIDKTLLTGCQHIAGEWGHNPLPWPQDDERQPPPCWCGKTGCLETWLSGPGLAADHARRTGEDRTAHALFEAAQAGDPAAAETVNRHAHRLARGLASVINLVDPDIVVLGGGVSNAPGLADRVTAHLPDWIFSDICGTRIVRHQHGDASGVRGAAWLWPAEQGHAA